MQQPLDEPVGLGVTPLDAAVGGDLVGRPPDERDHERLGVLDHPVVLGLREAAARHQGVVAAVDPGRARHAAPEDLQLVGQDGCPVLDPEVGRRIEDEVLLALRPERAAAGRVVAHLDGGPVDAEECSVGLAVERPPVVPALGDFRASVLAAADAALVPLVDRPLDASADRLDCRLVGVQTTLVPVEELVVLEPRVVRLRQPVDEGGVVVPVHEEPDRGEPFELECGVGAHLRLGLDKQVSVEVEAIFVLPPSGHATVGVRGRDDDHDGVVEELVDRVVRPARQGDEIADRLHHRVGALTLSAVDVRLDEHGQLDVFAPGRQQGLGCGRVGQHELSQLLPPREVALLLGGLERVDHDPVEVPTEGGLSDGRVVQPVRDAGCSRLGLELGERAGDRPVGNQRQRCRLRDVLAGGRGAPVLPVRRAQPG